MPGMDSTQPPAKLKTASVAVCFYVFAYTSILAVGFAIFLLNTDNSIDNRQGAALLPIAFSGFFFCLAVATIIKFLGDSTQRLERIEKLLERQ